MNTLHFIATGYKNNSYIAYFNDDLIDRCIIDSKNHTTQAHLVIAGVIKTIGDAFDITFDDTKALQKREYSTVGLLNMAQVLEGMSIVREYPYIATINEV